MKVNDMPLVSNPLIESQHLEECGQPGSRRYCEYDCPFYEFSGTGDTDPMEFRQLLTTEDNSRSYEMNKAALIRTRTGYAIVHLSGCSCWAGEGSTYLTDDPERTFQSLLNDNFGDDRDLFRSLRDQWRRKA